LADKDLLFGNPFLAAMHHYSTNEQWITQNSRRTDAIQDTVKRLIAEDEAEFAQMFLKVLSGRVLAFYPDKVLGAGTKGVDAKDTSYIFRFAVRPDIEEPDFVFILERAALLWEEVDGRAELILPKAPPAMDPIAYETGNSGSLDSERLARCVEYISAVIQFLRDPGVVMIQHRNGLQIRVPQDMQERILDTQSNRESYSILGLLQMFPSGNGVWNEAYYQIVQVIRQLNLRPTSVYDAPLGDFSAQPDVDEEIFLMVLEEALQNLESDLLFAYTTEAQELVPAAFNEAGDYDGDEYWR
jgi:hypothetical protein